MNIKRCVRCGKPLRADATYCKVCGHKMGGESTQLPIASREGTMHRAPTGAHPAQRKGPDSSHTTGAIHLAPTNSNTSSRNRDTRRTGTRPTIPRAQKSIPPASPHRAGHSSGLHPEDQPYQSSFIAALRPPTPAILSPSPLTYPLERVLAPTNPNATWTPASERLALDSRDHLHHEEDVEEDEPITAPAPVPASLHPNAIWMPKSERVRQGKAVLPHIDTPPVPHREQKAPEPLALPKSTRNPQAAPALLPDSNPPSFPGRMHRISSIQERAVPLLLTISCLFFLVATSLLAYAFLSQRHAPESSPTLTALPDSGLRPGDPFTLTGTGFGSRGLVTFHLENSKPLLDEHGVAMQVHADVAGIVMVQMQVPMNWNPGTYTIYAIGETQQLHASTQITIEPFSAAPPRLQLQLANTTLDLGAGAPGVVSKKTIILSNAGGGHVSWQATSSPGWLAVIPNKYTFAGTEAVEVSVNRSALPAGLYTGHITFTQQGPNAPSITLTVKMSVQAPTSSVQGSANRYVSVTTQVVAPPNLALAPTSLTLQAAQGQQSKGQITLQNSGGQPLDWTVHATSAWLNVSNASGQLDPAATQSITVTANAGSLAANTYSGTLIFTYGTSTEQVAVNFTVIIPPTPSISVQPSSLVFNTTQGINPPPQYFTLTNSGNAVLNWATSEDASGTTYAATSSSSTNSLAPGKSVTITITPKVASANPGTITGLITVFDKDTGSTVPQQQVTVTITITPAAIITATPATMTFNEGGGITSEEELLSIANTGAAPLDWSLALSASTPASWLSFDTPSGTLAPGATFTVNVTCDSSQLTSGTYTATLVVSDSDPNSPVLSQAVTVTLVVS